MTKYHRMKIRCLKIKPFLHNEVILGPRPWDWKSGQLQRKRIVSGSSLLDYSRLREARRQTHTHTHTHVVVQVRSALDVIMFDAFEGGCLTAVFPACLWSSLMAGFGPGDAFSLWNVWYKESSCAFSFDIYPLTKAVRFCLLIGTISWTSSQSACSFT